jgi:hypothetical protein
MGAGFAKCALERARKIVGGLGPGCIDTHALREGDEVERRAGKVELIGRVAIGSGTDA